MEYTIQKLALIAGVSTRTLRYYDEIGLLRPARVSNSGYRIYGKTQLDRLQQILFYRELDFSLDTIQKIISAPDFDAKKAMLSHYQSLLAKRERLDRLICTVETTIKSMKGEEIMTDQEKFDGFKQALIAENEEKYGDEIREKYGEKAVEESYQKLKSMTGEEYAQAEALNGELMETLLEAYQAGDPSGPLAQKAADLHRRWLCFYWPAYSREAHAGLGQMYVDDPRFTDYYDRHQPGLAVFLRDAIRIYTGISG